MKSEEYMNGSYTIVNLIMNSPLFVEKQNV